MRSLKFMALALVLAAMLPAADLPPSTQKDVIDRILAQEYVEMRLLRQYAPLVETYIQYVRADKQAGDVPDGDKYFLGRAELAHGVVLESLNRDPGMKRKIFGGMGELLSTEFVPGGFLQMIYLDMNGFDRNHYTFAYVGREFLGEVRCLVIDVRPLPKSGKGRFVGRIWVEDQDFNVVRFNGGYGGGGRSTWYFHFDSWRSNVQPGLWLPAFVYSEESNLHYAMSKKLDFKAQTRIWGYDLGRTAQEQELSKVLVESNVKDESTTSNDLTPLQAQRNWDRQAEDNVTDRLQRLGLVAPKGDVDKVLETVVNNLEVTNNLDIEPDVRCRVMTTTTLESYTLGHTIVLSRGLIDVLPDEASLAAIVAHELSHVVLGHRMDSQYAFFDQLLIDDKDTFRHFGFARTPEEEDAANKKGAELLTNALKDPQVAKVWQLSTASLFFQALQSRQKEVPNLISPHLGNRVPVLPTLHQAAPVNLPASGNAMTASADPKPASNQTIAALPIDSRVKMDPWSDKLEMLKSKPVGAVAEREKMPFEVTPFMPYLTRYGADSTKPIAASAQSAPDGTSKADPPAVKP